MAGFIRKTPKANEGGKFEPAPAGQHLAVCVAFVDLGTQVEAFKGEPPADVPKLFLAWELVDEVTRPVVGRDFRDSLHTKSNLRQWLKSWRNGKDLEEGEEFDLTRLVGQKCLLTIEHKKSGDRTFASVINLTAVHRSTQVPEPEHKPYCWTRMDGTPFRGPDWLPFLYGRPIEDWVAGCKEALADRMPAGEDEADADDFASQPGAELEEAPPF
jgi:hypothetical protein